LLASREKFTAFDIMATAAIVTPSIPSYANSTSAIGQDDRPFRVSKEDIVASGSKDSCDACRRRNSKCILPPEHTTCTACDVHAIECSFPSTNPRKRKPDLDDLVSESLKRRFVFWKFFFIYFETEKKYIEKLKIFLISNI
jgi:hypothetical protein